MKGLAKQIKDITAYVKSVHSSNWHELRTAGYSRAAIEGALAAGDLTRLPDGTICEKYWALPTREPLLKYRGKSEITGFRTWTGSAEIVERAKLAANAKQIEARYRPNGGNGCHLLTIGGRLPWLDPAPPEPPADDTMPVDHPVEDEIEQLIEMRRQELVEANRRACAARVKQIRCEAIARQQEEEGQQRKTASWSQYDRNLFAARQVANMPTSEAIRNF